MASEHGSRGETRLYSGWGRTAATSACPVSVGDQEEVARLLRRRSRRGVIPRGLGRSYGDAAQCAGGQVLECRGLEGLVELDLRGGVVTARAGCSFDQLMRWLVPLGWFVPVTPGTRAVTVGGAVAADIHGKNHHRDGSFGHHLRSLRLEVPEDGHTEVSPDRDPELFWATVGGMGLTGVVLDATFGLQPIETSRLVVDTRRLRDLDELLAELDAHDHEHPFSVAWIDLLASGTQLGRSVLTRGRFASREELAPGERGDPLAFDPPARGAVPPWVPGNVLGRRSVRAFNELWFRTAPANRTGEIQAISTFFHPLDMIAGWNRLYGPRGFLQWQCVLPPGSESTLRGIVESLSAAGVTSFLAVLKRFGPGNAAPLSFPMPGWTLSLDIPAGSPGLGPLLDHLDLEVAEAGGRLYLAKDSRMRPEILRRTYPRLAEWEAVRARVDPNRVLVSDLARRLGL